MKRSVWMDTIEWREFMHNTITITDVGNTDREKILLQVVQNLVTLGQIQSFSSGYICKLLDEAKIKYRQ
jgi:hypothetical protein